MPYPRAEAGLSLVLVVLVKLSENIPKTFDCADDREEVGTCENLLDVVRGHLLIIK